MPTYDYDPRTGLTSEEMFANVGTNAPHTPQSAPDGEAAHARVLRLQTLAGNAASTPRLQDN